MSEIGMTKKILFGRLCDKGLRESNLKVSILVLMQVERPLKKSWEALGSFFILIFQVFSVFCFFVFYTWTLTTAPGIPSPFIQDETGDKVGASKDVKEDDSGSSKEAKGSQNGHALNKRR